MTIVFVQADGTRAAVRVREGASLMEAALRASIAGIEAKCRGNCACVTCHVYLDPVWHAVVGAASAMEASMLDFAEGVGPGSRLACQVRVGRACDGMEVHIPREQRTLGF